MTRKFDPRPRLYTELCNRIGSPRLGPPLAQKNNADPLEDYWEDASVSLRSYHSWEAPSSPWLDVFGTSDEKIEEGKTFHDLPSDRIRHCRFSFDASNDCFGSMKSRRSFPPPLASCPTLSIKEGGRFVLKEMDAGRPQGFFQAQRGNGRLLLRLVLPDEVNEEDAGSPTSDGEDDDTHNNEDDDGEDEDNSSVIECLEESRSGFYQLSHVGSDVHIEGFAGRNHQSHTSKSKESIESNALEGMQKGTLVDDYEFVRHRMVCEGDISDSTRFLGISHLYDGAIDTAEASECPASLDVSKEGAFGLLEELQRIVTEGLNSQLQTDVHLNGSVLEESGWGTTCSTKEGYSEETDYLRSIDLSHIAADSSYGKEQKDLLGVHQQELLWNVDVTNHARTSLSPWSPKQLCIHPTIVNMRPALGLAMS